jgi:hypothetical protein
MGPEGQNITEHISEKYGSTPEQSQKNREMIRARRRARVCLRTDGNSRIYNTFDAHRLLHWAALEGLQAAERGLVQGVFQRWRVTVRSRSTGADCQSVGLTGNVPRRFWRTNSPTRFAKRN